jgi:hypothetical protein
LLVPLFAGHGGPTTPAQGAAQEAAQGAAQEAAQGGEKKPKRKKVVPAPLSTPLQWVLGTSKEPCDTKVGGCAFVSHHPRGCCSGCRSLDHCTGHTCQCRQHLCNKVGAPTIAAQIDLARQKTPAEKREMIADLINQNGGHKLASSTRGYVRWGVRVCLSAALWPIGCPSSS